MLISKEQIQEYLNRKVESYTWLKKVPRKELLNELQAIKKGKFWKYKPFHHQLVGIFVGVCLERFLFYYPMGSGKTKMVLDIFSYRKKVNGVSKALV